MKLITPEYYGKFACIAEACRDNCCRGGWQIGIDEETVDYYRTVKGTFGRELNAAIECEDEYCFARGENGCPLLDEKGLCRVYQELGPEHMGVVCAQFPRYSEYYGRVKETGIGLACEEAARIILSSDDYGLAEEPLAEEPYDDPEFDAELYAALVRLRENFYGAMKAGTLSSAGALRALLMLAGPMQERINENDREGLRELAASISPETLAKMAQTAMQTATQTGCTMTGEELTAVYEAICRVYDDMEPLNAAWEELWERAKACCDYGVLMEEGLQAGGTQKGMPEPQLLRLVAYDLFRYLTPVCYDHNILGAAQFMAGNYLVLHLLWQTADDPDGVLHSFSREVEYSTNNQEILYEDFLFEDCFDPETLCRVLTTISKK